MIPAKEKRMANGYSVIPIDDSKLARESLEYLIGEFLYAPETVPPGRFPTLSELRRAIQEYGYTLEETGDWYVTSPQDHTEIWFSGAVPGEDQPSAFWFRRGDTIVLNIMQALANTCGSFVVADHTGAPSILILPDSMFGSSIHRQPQADFVDVMVQRFPIIIQRLDNALLSDTLFLLSQIRQVLKRFADLYPHTVHNSAETGMPTYQALFKHADSRVRFLAFDLVALFRNTSIETTPLLAASLAHEPDVDIKARMIWTIEPHVAGYGTASSGIPPWTKKLIDILLTLADKTTEVRSVQFAAVNMVIRAQPGYWTTTLRDILISAFVQPDGYTATWNTAYEVNQQALETIKLLQWQQRLEILRTALPRVYYAQDAHRILRALLDNLFFGAERTIWMSGLPQDHPAERPAVDPVRFRKHESVDWLYPIQATKLDVSTILPIQQEVLAEVLDYDVPWMVHSNLLEKYGLPATRAEVKALLNRAG